MVRVVAAPRAWARGLMLVVTIGLWLGLLASSAWAGKGVVSVFGSSGSGDGQFANAYGTAANLGTGDVYVVDQFGNRVMRFDSSGGFLGAFGWGVADGDAAAQTCSNGCQPGIPGNGDGQFDTPQGVAVDQSDGSVYVVDGNNNRVEKFDGSGAYQTQFGTAGSAEGQLSGPQGIAVDSTDGSAYVADSANNRIEKFDSSGAFVSMFGFGVADGNSAFETCSSGCQPGLAVGDEGGFSGPTRVVVDSSGQVYVLDAGNSRIERYTSVNAFDQVIDPTDVFLPQEIAIGPGNDHLYVAQWAQDFSEQHVIEIDTTGALVDTHAVGSTASNSSGLALSVGSQKIYLADGFNARVFILDDVNAPDVTIDPATNITSTSASLSGTVTPNPGTDVSWRFEISTDDASWSPVTADQDAGNGSSPVPVRHDLSNLLPNTTYFVRLVASRPLNAPAISPEIQFSTPAIAPAVTTDPAQDITPTHVTLEGRIDPHNSPTTYFFEYGTSTAYTTRSPATEDADAGSGNELEGVLQPIYGLQPNTTYHYRLVAANQVATIHGTDQTFTTTVAPPASTPRPGIPGSPLLPDNRGWEKVSLSDKNGADIMSDSQRARVATDGNAANFASLTGFGDAIGTSTATDYLSGRNSNGWATHAITPRQQPTSIQDVLETLQPRYVGSFSDDLSKGVFFAASPLTADPNVANVVNLYRRDNLRTPGPGSYQLLSSCPLCESTNTPVPPLPSRLITGGAAPLIAGTSADFEHVIFESQQPLTGDAPSGCTNLADRNECPGNLYEGDHGTLRLAGILPDSACGSPPCPAAHGSQAGQGAGGFRAAAELTPHTISADGSRIFFTAPDFPGSQTGALYMRVNHTTTVQLNASERTPPDPNSQQPAQYWDASLGGARVFFSTTEALTDNAPTDGNRKLYMYDVSRPDSDLHNLTLISADGEPKDTGDFVAVQGVSNDGHYVYFGAAGQLVAGEPFLDTRRALYVWHDGIIRYITSIEPPDLNEDTNTVPWDLSDLPTARVTPDGLHLLFSSTAAGAGPTGYDQGHCNNTSLGAGCREFYVYSFDSQRLACVSCDPNGAPATASAFTAVRRHNSGALTTSAQNHPLSDDGRRVFFSTVQALAPGDVNGNIDVYEYDVPTGSMHLITSGVDRSDSYFMNASASGSDAFFLTRQQLSGTDADDNYDMYDARVNGGFHEPTPPAPPCSGDACRTSLSGPPDAPSRGSSLIVGSSTPQPSAKKHAIRCKKGYVRKKVRGKTKCVKKRKARVHKVSRASKSKRARAQERRGK